MTATALKIYSGVSSISETLRGAVLAVGNFDGVHLGHQRILDAATSLAASSGAEMVVMTFEPHPLAVLTPDHAPARLTTFDEKVRLFAQAGVHSVIRLVADKRLLALPAETFVREVLIGHIRPSHIVEGPGFRFGQGRKGDVDLLRAMAREADFQLHIVEHYRLALASQTAFTVSSTLIRRLLANGAVEDAAACLGRPYCLVGSVVRGDGAGRHLGFPTMNLAVPGQLVPAEGVYAGRAEVANVRAAAAISIGRRPTLSGNELVVEAYVLDQTGDWYGRTARLGFVRRIRDQVRFETREALTRQIARDVEAVRAGIREL